MNTGRLTTINSWTTPHGNDRATFCKQIDNKRPSCITYITDTRNSTVSPPQRSHVHITAKELHGKTLVDRPLKARGHGSRRSTPQKVPDNHRQNEEQHRLEKEAHERLQREAIAGVKNAQQQSESTHANERRIRVNNNEERRERLETSLRQIQDDMSGLQERDRAALPSTATISEDDNLQRLLAESKHDNANSTLALEARLYSKTEEMLRETRHRIGNLESHIPMINDHFDHQINTINPQIDPATRQQLADQWNRLRNTELHNKNHDLNLARMELNSIANAQLECRQHRNEAYIYIHMAKATLTHLKEREDIKQASATRMEYYQSALSDIHAVSKELTGKPETSAFNSLPDKYSFLPSKPLTELTAKSIQSEIATLQHKKTRDKKELCAMEHRVTALRSHPPLINEFFNHWHQNANDTELAPQVRDKLQKDWRQLRDAELIYKQKQINISLDEIQKINTILKARNDQLNELKQAKARVETFHHELTQKINAKKKTGEKPGASEKISPATASTPTLQPKSSLAVNASPGQPLEASVINPQILAGMGRLAVAGCVKNPLCREKIAGSALGTALGAAIMDQPTGTLSAAQKDRVFLTALSGDPAKRDRLSAPERIAFDDLLRDSKKGLVDIITPRWKDATNGKLANPVQPQPGATILTTPDRRGELGAGNTGNVAGKPETGGNTTVTPLPDGPNRDDLAYLEEKGRPESCAPDGAARAGAFNEAKRRLGVPVNKTQIEYFPI